MRWPKGSKQPLVDKKPPWHFTSAAGINEKEVPTTLQAVGLEHVLLEIAAGKSRAQVARELGVHVYDLHRFIRDAEVPPEIMRDILELSAESVLALSDKYVQELMNLGAGVSPAQVALARVFEMSCQRDAALRFPSKYSKKEIGDVGETLAVVLAKLEEYRAGREMVVLEEGVELLMAQKTKIDGKRGGPAARPRTLSYTESVMIDGPRKKQSD